MPLQRSPTTSSQPNLTVHDDDIQSARLNLRERKNPENENIQEFCDEIREMIKEFRSSQESKLDTLNKAFEDLAIKNTKLIETNIEIEKTLQDSIEKQKILSEKVVHTGLSAENTPSGCQRVTLMMINSKKERVCFKTFLATLGIKEWTVRYWLGEGRGDARSNIEFTTQKRKNCEFFRELNILADTCNYGILWDELIRDRLTVGVLDK
ncbi:hypothetical protein ACJJTC_017321 [Scirpophaga incertulas]